MHTPPFPDPPHDSGPPPVAVNLTGPYATAGVASSWVDRLSTRWLTLMAYVTGGILLGLVVILVLALTRIDRADPAPLATTGAVTDDIVRLHARDIGTPCWSGVKSGPARVTVSMVIGADGKVRTAVASGESARMRSCVESHVRGWEFLPQASAQSMVLPFEIDRR